MIVRQDGEAPRFNKLLWSRTVRYCAGFCAVLAGLFVMATCIQVIPMSTKVRFGASLVIAVLYALFVVIAVVSDSDPGLTARERAIPIDRCLYDGMETFAQSNFRVDDRFEASQHIRILRVSPRHWISMAFRGAGILLTTLAMLVCYLVVVFLIHHLPALPHPPAGASQPTAPPPDVKPPIDLPLPSHWHLVQGWHGIWWLPWFTLCIGYLLAYYEYAKWQSFVFIGSDKRNLTTFRYRGALWWRTVRPNIMPVNKPDVIDYKQSWLGKRLGYGYLILDAPTTGDSQFHLIGPLPDIANAHADALMAAEALWPHPMS